jgi:acyl-CoA hydrolase
MPIAPVAADALDLGALLRPGDRVVCGQTAAEPLTLTRKLLAEAGALPLQVFLGTTLSDTFAGTLPPGMRFLAYGAMGRNAALADRRLLDVLPEPYGLLSARFASGLLGADVVLLQAAPGPAGRRPSLGLAHDYTLAAARRARVLVVELNPGVPWTHGAELPEDLRVDHWVHAQQAPLTLPEQPADAVALAIAGHVAALVPDGATLQTGIGTLPDAVLAGLAGHRDLGLHSGVLGDTAARLVQGGALTNKRKGMDAGISVANTVIGGAALYRWVHDNPAVQVRESGYTHGAQVLARLHALRTINAALEVDLSGQVNCEAVGGRQRGGIGGLVEFTRAARFGEGGRAITVLPATAAGGRASRIVAALDGPATLGRADADLVVTEYGVADLRHATLAERARRLTAIAAPAFRDELERAWRASPWGDMA